MYVALFNTIENDCFNNDYLVFGVDKEELKKNITVFIQKKEKQLKEEMTENLLYFLYSGNEFITFNTNRDYFEVMIKWENDKIKEINFEE